jgi:hypothetical protein
MIPARFVFLKRFPLTAHGKIDRDHLRRISPSPVMSPLGEGPATDTEALLAEIWREVFGTALISRHDDFFDLGGDSLTAAVVAARIHALLEVELSLNVFIGSTTLLALAGAIDARRGSSVERLPRLVRTSRQEPLPLSYAQERIWKFSRTPETSAGYTVACSHRILGPLDVGALRDSIGDVSRRHEILRTTFAEVDGQPVQIVHPPMPMSLPLVDLAETANAEEHATGLFRSEANRPFDLICLPLLRFWLVRIRKDEHWLLRISHHIISDTWSWKVFFRELSQCYEARLRGERLPLPESDRLQYGDYAAWQRKTLRLEGRAYQDTVTWWKGLFSPPPPPLEFPFRRVDLVEDVDPREGLIWWGLDLQTTVRLDRVASEEGATYYAIRLAAFTALLAGVTGQPDVVLGTYVTNRSRVEVQSMFGFFVNLATLRLHCDGSLSFRQWVSAVRKKVGDAQSRGEVPYEQLCDELRKQGVNPPEIRAIFSVSDHTAPVRFGGLELTWLDRRMERMPWGFSLTFDQYDEQRRNRVAFDARLYDPNGVRELLAQFVRFLAAVSARPDEPLKQLLAESDNRARPSDVAWEPCSI